MYAEVKVSAAKERTEPGFSRRRPLADGRLVGHLRAGDEVDGSSVVSAELVAYSGGATFDLLPAGKTGAYWANGVLIASTLSR
jgi:hypothetical protein